MNEVLGRRARILPRLAWLALGLAAGACGSTPGPGEEEGKQAREAHGSLLESGDPTVERYLSTRVRGERSVGGVRCIDLELSSSAPTELTIAWTVEWFDRRGHPIAVARPAWSRCRLSPGGATRVEIRAPGSEADSWRLLAVDSENIE